MRKNFDIGDENGTCALLELANEIVQPKPARRSDEYVNGLLRGFLDGIMNLPYRPRSEATQRPTPPVVPNVGTSWFEVGYCNGYQLGQRNRVPTN